MEQDRVFILSAPPVDLRELGLSATDYPKEVTVALPVYLVEIWHPAAVPTPARPGSWVIEPYGFLSREGALAYLGGVEDDFHRVIQSTAYVAVQTWIRPEKEAVEKRKRG